MTTGFFSILHPTFESLSAYADMPELEAARSRVGRHIAKCAECRHVVDDILRLGDEARAAAVRGAPDGLWSRISSAAAVAAEEQPIDAGAAALTAAFNESAPSVRPRLHSPISSRRAMRVGVGLAVAAAAAIVAVLAWPGGQSLQATGLTRLTYSPSRPLPGGMLTIRYQASPWLRGAPRLVLVGKYSAPAGQNSTQWRSGGLTGDSIATLLPARDGAYEARVRLPQDFLAMQLTVVDSVGEEADLDGLFTWGVIAGERNGAPSLAALLAARETFAETRGNEGAAAHNPRMNVADSLKRYFPAHPAGWAYARDYGTQKGVFSFLRFFQSAEKKYASLYEKLWPTPSLDAERLHDMSVFASRIEEPAQEAMWVKRLVREHPEDPRALRGLVSVLHELELRQPPAFADSIRRWLPLVDSLYRRGAPSSFRGSYIMSMVENYGDSATKRLWLDRYLAVEGVPYMIDLRTDAGFRALTPAYVEKVRLDAAVDCARPAGKFRLLAAASWARRRCMFDRAQATGTLARLALVRGDARNAITLADSANALYQQVARCSYSWGDARGTSARARLALGDTAAAERELMLGIPPANQDSAFNEMARTSLGPRFDAARWSAAREKAHGVYRACQRETKAESEAAAAKRRERAKL